MDYPMRTMKTLEIVGGALCLDFANTINSRYKPEHDYLIKYSDLADWAVKVGILSVSQRNRLISRTEPEAKQLKTALQQALILRELFYRLFSRVAKRSKSYKGEMEVFVKFYSEAILHSVFVKKEDRFVADWSTNESFDAVLWPIVYSAGQLLLSKELTQVKECPNCGWLFLDTSKNHSRRWCSMNTCGARDKMRRYHRKLRAR
jgi:predicted RNA-binding Zn ribbon-like protein